MYKDHKSNKIYYVSSFFISVIYLLFFYGIRASTRQTSNLMSSSKITTDQPTVISMPTVTTVKLNHDNFLLWKAQLVPYFKGQDLFGYLDGSIPKLLKIISVTNSETATTSERLNPAYSHWIRQDNLILSTLMTSLSEPILAQVVNYTTSMAVWNALDDTFSSRSRARILQIRT